MALLTGWLYYWGRVKFHDLRAEMTNTPYIAFTLLEQVMFSWINNQNTGFKIKSQLLAWICRLFLSRLTFSRLSIMNHFFSLSAKIVFMTCDQNLSKLKFHFLLWETLKKHVWRDFKKISHTTNAFNCQNNVTIGIFVLINMCFITTIPLFRGMPVALPR